MARVLPEINFPSFTAFYCTLPEKHIENTFIFVEFVPLLINFIAFTVFNNLKWNFKWPWKRRLCRNGAVHYLFPAVPLLPSSSRKVCAPAGFTARRVRQTAPSFPPSPPRVVTRVGTAVKRNCGSAIRAPQPPRVPASAPKTLLFLQLHKSKLEKVKTTRSSHQLVKV